MIDYQTKKENLEKLLTLYDKRDMCLQAINETGFYEFHTYVSKLDLDPTIVKNIEKLFINNFKLYLEQTLTKTEKQIKQYDRTNL